MPPPLAYFISWTTKGSWLHGDPRGWVRQGVPGIQEPDPRELDLARQSMNGDAITLDPQQRQIVSSTIRDHCSIRGWTIHALNPRTNHIHVVVSAAETPPEIVMEQLKAWCSRRLNERASRKRKWWTEHGSTKWINDQAYFENAVKYVTDGQ